ncbi:MAG TPA: thioredoxin family protein [Rubrivivax sp.]|jgi:thioredoxin 1|nr:thioredoxin family protein [Pseudomonadota bacterium]HOL38353.1 thioredoxin family protein [Rubrivivax sp.]HPP82850.1 thioredoxin family protein [Rubrivivax sp.]
MDMTREYTTQAPTREEIDALPGTTLVEFGTSWCGHCQRAQPLLESALAAQPQMRHLKIEDGPGRRLGRTFGVKLWPTLIVLRDGHEIARLVRPTTVRAIAEALSARPDAAA